MLQEKEIHKLQEKAIKIRIDTIRMIGKLGVGHLGGSMSIVDILVLLYEKHLQIDPRNPKKRNRDRFILSKGHAGPALYSVLADKEFFPASWLSTLNKGGTNLPSHVDMNRTPGVDMTAGSLGQGLSAAIGILLGLRIDAVSSYVYTIISDGESNEGQVWEAAMAAAQFKLSKLIAFTDYNRMQIDGFQHEVMSIEDINAKWLAFGWYVQRVNGHDFFAMDQAIENARQELTRPSMIILDTIKGQGASLAEGKPEGHSMRYGKKESEQMIRELQERI